MEYHKPKLDVVLQIPSKALLLINSLLEEHIMTKESKVNILQSITVIAIAFYFAIMQMIAPSITSYAAREAIGYITVGLLSVPIIVIFKILKRWFSTRKNA